VFTTLVTLLATTNSKSYQKQKQTELATRLWFMGTKAVVRQSEKITYLSSILVTNEETVLNFDNTYHVAVLNFILGLGRWLKRVILLLVLLLRSANELLLWLGPAIQSVLGELRALLLKLLRGSLLLLIELLLILLGDLGTVLTVWGVVCLVGSLILLMLVLLDLHLVQNVEIFTDLMLLILSLSHIV
jgi:hypothetical protein